jgi:hypothetical protein
MTKLPHPRLRITLLILAASCVASAQNSDLGLLLGVIDPRYEVAGGPGAHVNASAGAAFQLNYAYQLMGWRAGDLYLEMPLFLAARGSTSVNSGGTTSSGANGIGALVPGVRFKLPLGGRASLYAAGGGGIGWFGDNAVITGPGLAVIRGQTTATAAFDFGGGLDLRLTRLLSLRGEARDLVTSHKSLSGTGGRNNPIYAFGFAFHF